MDIRSKLSDPSLFCEQGYIDGAWVDADGGGTVDVTDPATGDLVGTIPDMGTDETRRAIEAANAAWPAWRAKTAKERAALLRKWFDLMMANQRDLGIIMTAEQGKPLAEAMGEIAYGASYVEFFAEEAKRIYGDIIPNTADGKRIVVLKQPVGVVGSITPWNFPNAMIARKAAPALAAGCTFVAKPAKLTPFSAIAMAVLAERAGIPKGVFNVVCGASSSAIGNELTHSPLVRKITFTGSTEVGKKLIAQSASTVKKVSMELGGNAPLIIFDDADVDEAVKGAIICKYRNAGQTCVCANRIFVQDGIYDEFARKFAAAAKAMKMGNGFDDGVTVGPLIEAAAVDKVEEHVQDAVAKGAQVATGGARSNIGALFYEPTVLTGATRDMAIFREETFGPVAPLFRFKTEEEVIELANDTEFGLASYFYARDIGRVWRVAEALEYGMVAINEGILSSEVAPFGGVKESGLGREGSKYGLDDYLEIKYLLMGGLNG
ncbi:NAD-dependent succinate-semialdehyde dehydrogenase [Nisaea sp.]|uniref:NAD-dependent succinate-semialdehyde dehydrogenase n=1 Tax=Nisaea sp. TaxID=2024842 RepID=UPI0032F0203E